MVPRNLEDDYIKALLESPRRRHTNLYLGLQKEWSEQEYVIAKTSAKWFLDNELEKNGAKSWGKHFLDQWNRVLDPRLFRVAFNELSHYNSPVDEISEREMFALDRLIDRELLVHQDMTLRFDHMGSYRYQLLMGKNKGRIAKDLAWFYKTLLIYHTSRGYKGLFDAKNYLNKYPREITYWELICVKYGYHDWMNKDIYPFLPIENYHMISAKSVKIVREET